MCTTLILFCAGALLLGARGYTSRPRRNGMPQACNEVRVVRTALHVGYSTNAMRMACTCPSEP